MTDRPITQEDIDRHLEQQEQERQRKEAQRKEEAVKWRARQTWISQNGDPDNFEQAWSEKGGLKEQFSEEIQAEIVRSGAAADRHAREEARRSPSNKL